MKITGIDQGLCVKCSSCGTACPASLFKAENGVVNFVDPMGFCIKCGHCVAICPPNAVRYEAASRDDSIFYKEDSFEEIEQELSAKVMKNTLLKRRSVRKYMDKEVADEELELVMEAMGRSPSASNKMLRKYYVYSNRETLEKIDDSIVAYFKKLIKMGVSPLALFFRAMAMKDNSLTFKEKMRMIKRSSLDFYEKLEKREYRFLFNAPTLVIITAPENPPAHYKTFLNSDGHNAATHGVLMAESMGLGSCWIGFLEMVFNKNPKVKVEFGIPKGEKVLAAFTVGYPDIRYKRMAPRGPVPVKWFK